MRHIVTFCLLSESEIYYIKQGTNRREAHPLALIRRIRGFCPKKRKEQLIRSEMNRSFVQPFCFLLSNLDWQIRFSVGILV